MEYKVKDYLPINEKLIICQNVLNYSNDGLNFAVPLKVKMFTELEIIRAYGNVNVDYDNPADSYDRYYQDGTITEVFSRVPYQELQSVIDAVQGTIDSYYKFRNSALGILETISADYSELGVKADDIQKKLADPNNLTLVKDILTKLG